MKRTRRKIDFLLEQAGDAGFHHVKVQARKILQKHNNLDEFIMGMGTWFFTYTNGEQVSPDLKYLKPLSDFIYDYDQALKITGNPVRFTAYGANITDW